MSGEDYKQALYRGDLRIDCSRITLTQNTSNNPLVFSGNGYIYQLADGAIRFHMFARSGEESHAAALLHVSLRANLLAKENYLSFAAVAYGGDTWTCDQGCSTLWWVYHCQQVIDSCESGTVSVLGARCGLVGGENVEGEAAQAGEHTGIVTDARAVLAKGDIAAVMGGVLYGPMSADGVGGLLGGDRDVGDVERGLAGPGEQARDGIAGVDLAFDTDDGGDMVLPACQSASKTSMPIHSSIPLYLVLGSVRQGSGVPS